MNILALIPSDYNIAGANSYIYERRRRTLNVQRGILAVVMLHSSLFTWRSVRLHHLRFPTRPPSVASVPLGISTPDWFLWLPGWFRQLWSILFSPD